MDANPGLEYIEFQIYPSQNRYDASVCYVNKKHERVGSGLLDHLLLHSDEINALHSKGSNANYKLKPPEHPHNAIWFTKSTLERFLLAISNPKILDITNAVRREICQLEEARRFHLSLHSKGTEYQLRSGESGIKSSDGTVSTPQSTEGSDGSKNELLRAMDLRLSALRGELIAAFDPAIDSMYSAGEMIDLQKFSHHFGSIYLRDSLRKHIELIGNQAVHVSSSHQFSECNITCAKEGNDHHSTRSLSTSPAKVAHVERQNSFDSEESSIMSEGEQSSVEQRSRTLVRSASPRRSASPMRRVQIGRSGSRRSTAIAIKTLNYIPVRERSSFLPKNSSENDTDEEGPEQAPKKSDNNVRLSVQDRIHLFENKRKDQTGDVQNTRSLLNASTGGNKSVLRRWASGIGEELSHDREDISLEDVSQVQSNVKGREISSNPPETEVQQPGVAIEFCPIEHGELDAYLNSSDKAFCSSELVREESLPTESTNASDKISASAEWNRRTEAELNQLMMKMVETKPRNAVRDSSKRQSLPAERRGGFYDHYKEKRDEKLHRETARKKTDKDEEFKARQQILAARKSELAPAKNGDAGKKQNVKKLQKSQRNVSPPGNPKNGSPKPGSIKKATVKATSLPATRKSWPLTPSPRVSEASPVKTSARTNSAGTTQTRRSQPVPSVSRPNKKVETSQLQPKSVKNNEGVIKKNVRTTEKKQQSMTKPVKPMKNKVQTPAENPVSSAKPSLYSKVTKKGSVVPLESKPFLRKGSGTVSNVNPVAKMTPSAHPPEPLVTSEGPVLVVENIPASNSSLQVVENIPAPMIQHQESGNGDLEINRDLEAEICATTPQKCEVKESFAHTYTANDFAVNRVVKLELETDVEEEYSISPTAWVEVEKHEDQPLISRDHIHEMGSPAQIAPVKLSNPRIRHSLSQMLLEENCEPDISDWENTENPPAMAYQKDSPKGFKRLLKFARKSKTEANTTGWLSPTVFSEGEDDSEDPKFVNRRSAENLLKLATLQSKNNGNPRGTSETYAKNPSDYKHSAEANIGKSNSQNLSYQSHEGYASASVTTKATRSFFSLSAFKGSK